MPLVRLADLTWPAVQAAAAGDAVVLVPVGTVEQHGHHLPLDTDNTIAEGFCREAAARAPDGAVVVAPTVSFGLSEHLSDFPGTIFHTTSTFLSVLTEVFCSLAGSGFRRVLAVNGHGSNVSPLDLATRDALLARPDCLFASVSWWELGDVREVAVAKGPSSPASHACAFETSLMLAIDPGRVDMARAEPGEEFPTSAHVWRDMFGRSPSPEHGRPVHLTEFWSGWSRNGVRGDPRDASEALGRAMLDAGADELVTIVAELCARPILGRSAIGSAPQ